jgi:hypothetical protein
MESATPDPAAPPTALLSLGALADAFEVLQTLAEQPVAATTAAAIIRLSKWAHPYYQHYIEARAQQAAAFGEKIAEGKYNIPLANVGAYDQAMGPVRAERVEFDDALRVAVKDLAGAKISAAALSILGPFLSGL